MHRTGSNSNEVHVLEVIEWYSEERQILFGNVNLVRYLKEVSATLLLLIVLRHVHKLMALSRNFGN